MGKSKRPNRPGQSRRHLQRLEATREEPPAKQARLLPIIPAQQGGASGPAPGPPPPSAALRSERDLAEEAAATDREVVEDPVSASIIQTAYLAIADEELAAQQAARVPVQPATGEPAGGSSWNDV